MPVGTTALTVLSAPADPSGPTWDMQASDVAPGNSFESDGFVLLYARNTTVSAIDLIFEADLYGVERELLRVSIPGSGTEGGARVIGPFPGWLAHHGTTEAASNGRVFVRQDGGLDGDVMLCPFRQNQSLASNWWQWPQPAGGAPPGPPDPPGVPIVDLDAAGLSLGDITAWLNAGSIGDTWGVTGGCNAPEVIAAGPDGRAVQFVPANQESLASAGSFAGVLRPVTFAVVARLDAGSAGNQLMFTTKTSANANGLLVEANERLQVNPGGAAQTSEPIYTWTAGTWLRIAGTCVNTPSTCPLYVNEADHGPSTAASAQTPTAGFKLSANIGAPPTVWGAYSIARLVMWDDSTTAEEARDWLAARYPSL